jgi:hypothetical protein
MVMRTFAGSPGIPRLYLTRIACRKPLSFPPSTLLLWDKGDVFDVKTCMFKTLPTHPFWLRVCGADADHLPGPGCTVHRTKQPNGCATRSFCRALFCRALQARFITKLRLITGASDMQCSFACKDLRFLGLNHDPHVSHTCMTTMHAGCRFRCISNSRIPRKARSQNIPYGQAMCMHKKSRMSSNVSHLPRCMPLSCTFKCIASAKVRTGSVGRGCMVPFLQTQASVYSVGI